MPRQKCQSCHSTIGFDLPALSGGIGPTMYKCRSCETVIKSGKSEWLWHSRQQREQFKRVSLAIAVLIGGVVAGAMALAYAHYKGQWPVRNLTLIVFAAAVSAMTLMQSVRVLCSIVRDSRGDIRPPRVGVLSFETNSLWAILVPIVTAAVTFWAVSPHFPISP